MFLDGFVHLFDVVVRVLRVWEIHAHQFNTTSVDHDRCFDGALTDVIGVDNSFPPPSVQHDSNSVFVLVFSSTHEDVVVMCFPNLGRFMSPRFTQKSRVPSVSFEFDYQFFDFFT